MRERRRPDDAVARRWPWRLRRVAAHLRRLALPPDANLPLDPIAAAPEPLEPVEQVDRLAYLQELRANGALSADEYQNALRSVRDADHG